MLQVYFRYKELNSRTRDSRYNGVMCMKITWRTLVICEIFKLTRGKHGNTFHDRALGVDENTANRAVSVDSILAVLMTASVDLQRNKAAK
jgi:hypothetical protein